MMLDCDHGVPGGASPGALAAEGEASMLARLAYLEAECARQAKIIAEQAQMLAHSRKTFEHASAAARIGVWECDLSDNSLTWTDVVYEIFDLPRGTAIDREQTIAAYPEEARRILEATRSRAIEERTGFRLDTQIVTPKGNHRWIRITATVESEDGKATRIFGMKQDITEEKLLADKTRYLAENDVMTGLANRSRFQSELDALVERESAQGTCSALILIDLDGFKQINDTFGHAVGDECLKIAASRLSGACAGARLVARIGGDEFAVLVGPECCAAAVESMAARLVAAIGAPVDLPGIAPRLGASAGIAFAGAGGADELFKMADAALYRAKSTGRNAYEIFSESERAAEVA